MADAKVPPQNSGNQRQDQLMTQNQTLQSQLQALQQKWNALKQNPGYETLTPDEAEKSAGVTPPGWQGMTDLQTGQLLDQYKINPFAGAASQKVRDMALSTGPTDYAKAALGQQQFEEAQARGNVGLQQQQQNSAALANLSRMGGLGGGARTSLARSGARDALMAAQGVGAQGVMSRANIAQNDAQLKQQLLGTTADVERAGDTANIDTLKANLQAKAGFDANRYNQQMQAWAAKQQADATRAAGGGKGK